MARPKSEHPTELELTILKVLWEESPLKVREVRAALSELGRPLAHSSIITTLNIMVDKGYLKRKPQGKLLLFSPVVSQANVSKKMLGDVVDRVFDGSAGAVMLRLLETADLDREELLELRKIINRRAKEELP